MRWLLLRRYLEPQRSAVLLAALLLLLGAGLRLAGPRVARAFIDGVTAGVALEKLGWLALGFIGISLAAQGAKVLAEYGSEQVAWTATNALRLDLAAHLLRLDASFHKARTPGELIERVDGDVAALGAFFASFLVKLAGSLLILGGVLAALFVEDWRLGLGFTGFALALMAVLNWVRRFAVPVLTETRERSAQYYGYLGEVISAAEDLRASGATGYAMDRFSTHLRGWLPSALRAEVLGALVWVSAIGAFALLDSAAFGLSGWLHVRGAIGLGTVYMVVAYAGMLAQPMEMLRTQMQDLQKADASLARIAELFAMRPTLNDGREPLPPGPLSVAFDGASFWYEDGEPVLEELSFRLEPGKSLGLLGRTGSGKSTLARLLFRLYDPGEGAVRLGGVDVRSARLKELRSRVGLVTQEVQLFAATLRENLTFFDPAVPDAKLLAVLEQLGLRPWFDMLPAGLDTPISPAALSAGEAQLLAFARVFLKDPGLVILDEASSRLDPATEALLDRAVRRLLQGRTAIIIAHRLATVEQVDEILILEDGRLAEHGARAALAADAGSRFARLRKLGLEEVLR
ncbi:MAG TPA: ABC transporter ATP-binding protein [Symbiobacteriaceae bacterium]|nr:ABC transporter ATP-binding protein [Symbiobacteriaceae bacterium]